MSDTTELSADQIPPFLTRQLIAYIGNKRRLLPFLAPILARLDPGENRRPSFLDPMSGSGAVSRLARHLGWRVSANDWEEFAFIVTAAAIENTGPDLNRLFLPFGGVKTVIDELNRFGMAGHPNRGPGYIATHFAPASTTAPRIGVERLFYTAENARFLDRVRDRIDDLFPPAAGGADAPGGKRPGGKGPASNTRIDRSDTGRIRRVLLALLLYEASNHANTSGVFKAYHRGFGGHGKDALSRILAPMELEYPAPIVGPTGDASNEDVFQFVEHRTADLCYLDPPYNSHQYGSNYFMLNTIARWDKPPVDSDRDASGNLTAKAGIRPDWRETRSPFCYRKSAAPSLSELFDRIDAGFIVVSYSASGFVSPEEMADLLASQGDLTLHGTSYTAYRGGRQSMSRVGSGHELVFVVRRNGKRLEKARGQSGTGVGIVERQLAQWRLHELLRNRFVPERLRSEFPSQPGSICLAGSITVPTIDFYRLESDTVDTSGLAPADLRAAIVGLERARCVDHHEEFETVLGLIRTKGKEVDVRSYQNRLLSALRKFAHRKYREQFWRSVTALSEEIARRPCQLEVASTGLARIVSQAKLRFGDS